LISRVFVGRNSDSVLRHSGARWSVGLGKGFINLFQRRELLGVPVR